MCHQCNRLRKDWYDAQIIAPAFAALALRDYMEQIQQCPDHREQMDWAASGPPNPPLMEDEMEATH